MIVGMRDVSAGGGMSAAQFWRLNLIGWVGFAVFGFVIRWIVHEDPSRAAVFTLMQEPVAFVFSGLLWIVYRRPHVSDPFTVRTAAWMVALTFLAAAVQTAIAQALVSWTGWSNSGWTAREEWLFRAIFVWFAYLVWSLAYFSLHAHFAAQAQSEQVRAARHEAQWMELQLLRAQLDPHFLFNSLNGIAAEISVRPPVALEMVHELSDYLRYSLETRHHVLAPLAFELDAVTAYLKIEQARFGDRMQASVEAEVEARARLVPSFVLQPLIENAVKHGLQADFCDLRIFAGCEGDTLTIAISNPGRLPENLQVVEGVGLETLRRRLAFHYPDRATFELSQMDGVVTAELILKGEPCSV